VSTELKIAHYIVAAVLLIDSAYVFHWITIIKPSDFTIDPVLGYVAFAGIGIGLAWAAGSLVRRASK